MAKAPAPIEVKPGKLMSGLSSDSAGVRNYTVKRDFRRVLERDIRAEGYEWYRPNPVYDKLIQAIPNGSNQPITMISECSLGNGRIGLVAGNKTTIWRYMGLDDPNYFDTENSSNYFDTEGGQTYFDDGLSGWEVIGSGFSASGNRWEAVQVADYLVLNNSVDLPMTYNLQESAVKPIYELREQQIACVGTIAAQDGILCCMDISQINDAPFLAIMQPVPAAVNASQDASGKVSPAAATLFPAITPSALVGLTLFWANGQTTFIDSIDGSGFIHTNALVPIKDVSGHYPFTTSWTPTYSAPVIASGAVSVENSKAYTLFSDQNSIQRYGYRFFPSMPSNPRRFGASVPISFGLGDRIGKLLYPVRSIPELVSSGVQTSFQITGIGVGSTNLTANVIFTGYGITSTVLLDASAQTAQPFGITSNFQDQLQSSLALIEAADAAQSFAGIFEDLQDDDGRIIKALTLQGQLVIYKETPVMFLASYTGDLTTPFQFQKIPVQGEGTALYHRNTLIAGGGGYYGSYHLYAAKNGFYQFSLYTGVPVEQPTLQTCANIFFENASDTENTFSVENPLTREVFFVFPQVNGKPDNAICFDYAFNSARTTSAPISGAARARHPKNREYWFVMGQPDGSLKRYGLFSGPLQSSGVVKATLANGVVNLDGNFFTPAHVGMTIVFQHPNGDCVNIAAVAEYVSPTQVTVYAAAGASVPVGKTFVINPGMWHRDGVAYESVLQMGLDAFGFTHGEKMLNEYVLSLSSKSPNTPLSLRFMGGVNPAEGRTFQTAVIKSPDFQNLVKPTLLQYYIGLRISALGLNNPVEVVGQLFNVVAVASHSFGRRPLP